jgi:tetratricopeptide (TPR) repeat protein
LLNAMRGSGMICMFMGQIIEAAARIERAYDAFNSSSEEDRLTARAAGQDAGVADLALLSWTLWLLGQPDSAAARIEAALQRAEAIAHPHSQAYACYYAAVLYALRGEFAIAQKHAERCLLLSEQHAFRPWHGLARAVRGICRTLLDEQSSAIDEVYSAVKEYRSGGYQIGITALYVLLIPALMSRERYEEALEIIDGGLAIVKDNSEKLFAAELMRLKAQALRHLPAHQGRDRPQALLEDAIRTAREQGAKSLELRAAADLAELSVADGKRDKARDLLAPVLAQFREGLTTRDLVHAKALLELM